MSRRAISGRWFGASELTAWCEVKLAEHHAYVVEHMEDLPEIWEWIWNGPEDDRQAEAAH